MILPIQVVCDTAHTYPKGYPSISKWVWSRFSPSLNVVTYPICEVDMPKVRVVVLSSHSLYGEGV
ncbi:MAG: hypothetical protein KAJ55_04305, partial [Anaerolineales bacterium]|nr:hypothetical protein [Anaerolineales bacterium]